MPDEPYKHIFLTERPGTQEFTSPQSGGRVRPIPTRDRVEHSAYLLQRLEQAWNEAGQRRAVAISARNGVYLDFESAPNFDLPWQSLEARASGVRLMNVRKVKEEEETKTLATVFVPLEKRSHFLKKLTDYSTSETPTGRPKNQKLVESISDIRLSVLESFWQDETISLPGNDPAWVEVWLNSAEQPVIDEFVTRVRELNLSIADGSLKFPERAVIALNATRADLNRLIETSDSIAEFRGVKSVASFLEHEIPEQLAAAEDLLARTQFRDQDNIAVCILDTGVNNGHILLQPVLANTDLHTVDPAWGTHDHKGHGTLMAGTAAYGDLFDLLTNPRQLIINHRLESAKILPPIGTNPKELWGFRTVQGVSRAEITAPHRKRISCLAVASAETRDRGKPSSWSGAIDELSSGYEDGAKRLFVICAGNTDQNDWVNYPTDNLTNEIHDPGQAWNALTVGAYTDKTTIHHPTYQNWVPLAPGGGLSPFSTTSSTWPERKWPIKPEVLFEGGNLARGPNNDILAIDDLQLISTAHDPATTLFRPFNMTSAASAQAAWMAAQIQAVYSDAWPETLRALIVHSAKWTDAMKTQFLPANPGKRDYAKLLRVCGYGVPSLTDALYCATNSLTLISQADLQPFDRKNSRYVTCDMHLYDLPWPRDVLLQLGATQVEMRVTLSYFVEPSPGAIGWENRYRYPSYALRFDVNSPRETEREFKKRVNRMALEEGERPATRSPTDKWLIGEARDVGSIHSDVWRGTAADLATSNRIAVFPMIGWWRERHHLNRWDKHCRYSLIVSIHTPRTDVDIYTPVAIRVGVIIPIDTSRRKTR